MLHFCSRPGRYVKPYVGFSEEILTPLREGLRVALARWRELRQADEIAEEREKLPLGDGSEDGLRTLHRLSEEAERALEEICKECRHPKRAHNLGGCMMSVVKTVTDGVVLNGPCPCAQPHLAWRNQESQREGS